MKSIKSKLNHLKDNHNVFNKKCIDSYKETAQRDRKDIKLLAFRCNGTSSSLTSLAERNYTSLTEQFSITLVKLAQQQIGN